MKKTFFYEFLPSKEAEEAAKASGVPYRVTRTLIEIRDINPPPKIDQNNRWKIKKVVTAGEVVNGKLMLTHQVAFEYIFRYLSMEICKHVIAGYKSYIIIVDYTDENNPKELQGQSLFFQGGGNDTYILGWMELVQSRAVCPGDEIGLFCDKSTGTFGFKVLRRGGNEHLRTSLCTGYENNPKELQGQSLFFQGGGNDTYILGWMELVQSRAVCPGDEIGLFCDKSTGTFGFKVLRRGGNGNDNPIEVD
ncbi:hypothetical protein Q3G72_024263 [Acer saccharum]|nr:hypothetical protein Q3G72_024263 [Acer saccharum]